MSRELPAGKEWATVPLLDPANVGRYVWSVWNGNVKQMTPAPIIKIGRTNIHVGEYQGWSLRVEGGKAVGVKNGFGVSAFTETWRIENDERVALWGRVRRALDRGSQGVSTADLRTVADLLDPQEWEGGDD